MKDLTIVQAEKKDAEALLKYRNAIGVESDNLTFGREGSGTTLEAQEAFIQKTRKDEGSVIYVGKIDGEIVALGSITAYDKPRIRHRGELGLTVRKAYWNQGIATKMMQALMGFAKESTSCEVVELEVRSDNKTAVHLYEKFGFRTIGVYEKFFKIGEQYATANLMTCCL
ncbi:Protein N-acetyltransferase, RimJ/RimL family [Eubacterium maltosivorans]|uniref:GNAT family N-acetyltransferase n=1 Tax=Eubacterium maltosivorans TaxID=2041044 RepID=UPI0008803301|nr:GNAT family N-acetyltransferase [Eubacterium maltosivorans]WPK80886.1 L-amino acid N-acetyltransferase AaaT [Eubacterium maltosivorans]SDP74834.1 Protein N-acetyltransferase, RimJ/RimL family [Eubacterium maltosivorans]